MMQASLTSSYNKLLSFRHEEVMIYNLKEYFMCNLDCSYTYFQLSRTQNGRDTSAISNDLYIVIGKQVIGKGYVSSCCIYNATCILLVAN